MMKNKMLVYKADLYEELSRLTKGLGSEKRLEILNLLTNGPKSVEGISKVTGMSIANTSRHLQVLKESRLVQTSRDGNFIRYRLASEKVFKLMLLLFEVGEEQLDNIKVIEEAYDKDLQVPQIGLAEAITLSQQDNVLLLDVRPAEEFEAGHLPTAVNLPIDDFDVNKRSLPKTKKIIIYCRGRTCGYANLAAKDLRELGYDALSLNRSFADWQWK